MIAIAIRAEDAGDVAAVRQVNERAFGTSAEADLVDALRGSDGSISLVATLRGALVGHIMFTPVTLDDATAVRVAGLAPMSVLPEHQRAGVGTRLVRAGLAACRDQGYGAVVVVGHPEYYPRFGFMPAHAYRLQCEFEVPREAFMVRVLDAQMLPHLAGVARYRPEFAAAGAAEAARVTRARRDG
jgi:putative acetyltransferase